MNSFDVSKVIYSRSTWALVFSLTALDFIISFFFTLRMKHRFNILRHMPFLSPLFTLRHMLFLTTVYKDISQNMHFWCSFVCIYLIHAQTSGGELNLVFARVYGLSVCAHFRCVCVCARFRCVCVCARKKTSHTARKCYSNNLECLLCSPCAFGQSLYRVLIREIEGECMRWW